MGIVSVAACLVGIETAEAIGKIKPAVCLLAPIFGEQADSFTSGTLILPRPGDAVPSLIKKNSNPEGRLSELRQEPPKSIARVILWVWGITWAFSFLLAGLTPFVFAYDHPREVAYGVGGMWFLLALGGAFIHKKILYWYHREIQRSIDRN